ncbi:MAG: hypothetical protein WDM96_13775 [Lacunisphaera sp.]
MNTLSLPGCSAIPLAAYLKALGILRVLSQQCPDAHAKGFWRGNAFTLVSTYDREALLNFFLTRYAPSPVVAPMEWRQWLSSEDNTKALDAIAVSTLATFATYRELSSPPAPR